MFQSPDNKKGRPEATREKKGNIGKAGCAAPRKRRQF
jgi:hypothetical protein